jgi:CDP-paratose 2-epimerase
LKIFITGICGFVGSTLAKTFKERFSQHEIFGMDNFSRPGSWLNKETLEAIGVRVYYGDIRNESDLTSLPKADWLIDAAANPSVLAGVDGKTSSLQLVQNNLSGTVHLLEYCKRHQCGFILLSTSRVYSIPGLANLKLNVIDNQYAPEPTQAFPPGISAEGITEDYSVAPPVSLYGSSKVCSEHLALEYGATFDFPVWINRCGVLAGAGQFGHPAQGIFAYWIHSFHEKQPLKYIGFGGAGFQVRDILHPRDLVSLLVKQFERADSSGIKRVVNVSGGLKSAISLSQLTEWCTNRLGNHTVASSKDERPFDIGWMVLDNTLASRIWQWSPETGREEILNEISDFAGRNKTWLEISKS